MKDEIRKKLIEIRKKMPRAEVLEKSEKIKERLFETKEFKSSKTVLFYVSYGNEVFTHDMIKQSFSNKKIIVPISDKKNRSLILSELKNWNELEPGSYGILEPKKEKLNIISPEKIELIIVPGVGFDSKGNRIGHGKGYYDNLLKNSKKAIHIGLAFEKQIVIKIPVEYHDIPLDKIITENKVIDCIKFR